MTGQTKTHPCSEHSCWKECNHGCCKWGQFGDCSVSCGGGQQSRVCVKGSMGFKGKKEHRSCSFKDCPPQCPGGCCVWGPWSQCSKSCGGGMVSRRCHEGPRQGQEETRPCSEQSCDTGCKYGCCRWSGFSQCSASCGGGDETRTCIEGGHRGKTERRSCHWEECPTPPPPTRWPPSPTPCKWTEWGDCSVTCGTGQMHKWCRGGIGEGDTKTMPCKGPPCDKWVPPPVGEPVGSPAWVEHGCSMWGEWETCSKSCGEGMKYRVCMGGAEKGKRESQRCNERPCESWVPGTTPEDPGIVAPTPAPGPDECKHWNDWSKCGRSCLRCRCCADAPKYNPPRPSMPRECEHCSGGKCGKGPGPTWMKRKHKKQKKH